jgi:cytochrome b subunit of formate dehydrogenase
MARASVLTQAAQALRARRTFHVLLAMVILTGTLGALVCPAYSQSNVDCLMCHARGGGAPTADVSVFNASAHAGLSCTSCHLSITEIPHGETVEPVLCASCHDEKAEEYLLTSHGLKLGVDRTQAETCGDCHGEPHAILPKMNPRSPIARRNVVETCGNCHGDVAEALGQSVHSPASGASIGDVPVCTDCHGTHVILSPDEPSSPVYHTAVARTCSKCHGDPALISRYELPPDVVRTYNESFHGLALRYGSTRVANCASCHGYHAVLSSSNPASSVNSANLSETCRQCHPGAGQGVAAGSVHSSPPQSTTRIVRYVVILYVVLITLTICGMFLYDVLDFLRRAATRAWNRKTPQKIYGSLVSQKIQYLLLVVSFAVLAYTGFALNRPEAWWTAPLRAFDRPSEARALMHRIAAGVFIAVCVYYIFYANLTRRGREQFRALRPGLRDFKDFIGQVKYNIGLSKERPAFGRYDFVEKSEYWAIVWGSVVMSATGLLLVFNGFTLKYFPLWFSELATAIHFFEAVLAGLAAIVWHAYWTVFDSHGKK